MHNAYKTDELTKADILTLYDQVTIQSIYYGSDYTPNSNFCLLSNSNSIINSKFNNKMNLLLIRIYYCNKSVRIIFIPTVE